MVGSAGHVRWEEFGTWEIRSGDTRETGSFGDLATWQDTNLQAQAAFHRAMYDWAEEDRKVPGTHLADSLHEWAAVLALYQSALHHQPVALATFVPAPDLVDHVRQRA